MSPGRLSLSFGAPVSTVSSSSGRKRLGMSSKAMSSKASIRSNSFPTNFGNPASLNVTIESPPLVCFGAPKDSTGALISGLIDLKVHEAKLKVTSFSIVLVAEVVTRRPVTSHCLDCSTRTEEIHKWSIISQPVTLAQGSHTYPFNYHIPGTLPATNTNSLGRIKYTLRATAFSAAGDELKYIREINISRAILPGPERQSVRIFPPTNLSAHIGLPSVVHPSGDFPLTLRLDGIVTPERETRWRLRKISWRIEEHSQVISPACPHHPSKICADGKGILHEDARNVGSGEIKTGWKADYGSGGRIEMEFMAGIPLTSEAACNIDAPCGIKVSHNLVIELIVAEEYVGYSLLETQSLPKSILTGVIVPRCTKPSCHPYWGCPCSPDAISIAGYLPWRLGNQLG